jgi:tetratricopeptide (TPR) repeat protein
LRIRPPNPERARKSFEAYILLSGKKVAATIRVGKQLIRYSAFRDAARLFSTVSPEDIENPAVHLKLTELFLRGSVSNYPRAAAHVDQLLSRIERPTVSMQRDLLRLASQLDRAGLFQKAVSVLRLLQSSGRSNARVIRRLGRALLGQRKEAAAVNAFEQYIKLVGGRRAVREVGDAFYERGFYRRAKEYYLRLFSRSGRALLSRLFPRLVDTYLKLGDRSGIVALAKRYTELLPNARAHGEAARRLQDAGLTDEAFRYWSKAAQLQPNAVHFREQQARMALSLGRLADARNALDVMVSRTREPKAWLRAGKLLSSRGYDAEALTLYRRAVSQGIDSTDVMASQAIVLARLNRLDESQAVLTDALREADDLGAVVDASKEIFLPLGEVSRHRAVLEQAMTLYPEQASTWLAAGDLLVSAGDAEGATRFWEIYLRKEPRGAVEVASRFASLGNYAMSRRLLERVIASPNAESRDQALSELLSVLIANGRQRALPAVFEQFISAGLNPTKDMAALARGLSDRGWVDLAIRYLQKTLAREPVADGWLRVARLFLLTGDVNKAESTLERYLASAPASRRRRAGAVAQQLGRLRQVALLWEEFGYLDRAMQVLDASVHEHPGIGTLHVQRARLRLSSDDVLGALQALEGLLEGPMTASLIDPGELEALLKVVFQAGLQREALSIISRVPEEGRSPELSTALVRLSLMTGDNAVARAEVTRAIAASAEGQLRFTLARAYFDAGMMLEARELLESVLEPGRGLAAARKAIRLLVVIGRLQKDDAVIGRVIFLAGNVYEDRAELHRHLAEVLFSIGALEAAADQAEAWASSVGANPVGDKVLDEKAPHPWRLQVQIALQQGDEEGAYRIARHFVDIAESPREARTKMSQLLERLDAWTAAGRLLVDGIAQGVLDRSVFLTLARLSLEAEEPQRAEAWFARYSAAGDPSPIVRRRIARLWGQYGHSDRAQQILSQLPSVDPSIDDTAFLLLVRKGASDAALEEAQRAIKASNDPAVAATRLASRYLRSTDVAPTLALALSQAALQIDPEQPHPLALLVRGAAHAELGNAAQAWSDLRKSLDLGPADEVPFIRLGQSLGPLGARQWSIAAFMAKAVLGQQRALVSQAAELLTELKIPADARYTALVLREALTLTDGLELEFREFVANKALSLLLPLMRRPEHIPTLVDAVADLYERAGRLPEAITAYQKAIQQFPGYDSFSNNLAYLMARRNEDLGEALAFVDRSLQRNPAGSAAYLDTKGWILHRLGRNSEAAGLIEKSLRLMAGGPHAAISESLYHLGVVYLSLDRTSDAKRVFYRAIRIDEAGVYGRKASDRLRSLGSASMRQ